MSVNRDRDADWDWEPKPQPKSESGPVHPASLPVEDLLKDCKVERGRGSGPGGQHRNKVETAVIVTHEPSGVAGGASERRSQEENRRMAIKRLRINLAIEVRGYWGLMDVPSELWRSRCRDRKLAINVKHEDWPSLLAELMDVLSLKRGDVRAAGNVMGISASQVTKLLRNEPKAMALVNQWRTDRGQRPLK